MWYDEGRGERGELFFPALSCERKMLRGARLRARIERRRDRAVFSRLEEGEGKTFSGGARCVESSRFVRHHADAIVGTPEMAFKTSSAAGSDLFRTVGIPTTSPSPAPRSSSPPVSVARCARARPTPLFVFGGGKGRGRPRLLLLLSRGREMPPGAFMHIYALSVRMSDPRRSLSSSAAPAGRLRESAKEIRLAGGGRRSAKRNLLLIIVIVVSPAGAAVPPLQSISEDEDEDER